jgi:hypothetical protein
VNTETLTAKVERRTLVDDFPALRDALIARHQSLAGVLDGKAAVMRTSAQKAKMWEIFLASLPEDRRQEYNCNCCRSFIQRFGGLVYVQVINSDVSKVTPLIWPRDADGLGIFDSAVLNLWTYVNKQRVVGAFRSEKAAWGDKFKGYRDESTDDVTAASMWEHLSIKPFTSLIHQGVRTAHQAEASKLQDYLQVLRFLNGVRISVLHSIRTLTAGDYLPNGEKVRAQVDWLIECHQYVKPVNKEALMARIAVAPDGFCHPSTSMVSTLVDDIEAGKSFEQIK